MNKIEANQGVSDGAPCVSVMASFTNSVLTSFARPTNPALLKATQLTCRGENVRT